MVHQFHFWSYCICLAKRKSQNRSGLCFFGFCLSFLVSFWFSFPFGTGIPTLRYQQVGQFSLPCLLQSVMAFDRLMFTLPGSGCRDLSLVIASFSSTVGSSAGLPAYLYNKKSMVLPVFCMLSRSNHTNTLICEFTLFWMSWLLRREVLASYELRKVGLRCN